MNTAEMASKAIAHLVETGWVEHPENLVADAVAKAIAEEREACARIAESDLEAYSERMQAEIARRIRARGE